MSYLDFILTDLPRMKSIHASLSLVFSPVPVDSHFEL